MHRLTFLLLIIVAVGLAARTHSAPADEFAAGWQEGQKNEHDAGAGAAYIHQMVRSLGPALSASAKECGGTPAESKQPVQLALQLNVDGSVRKALIVPSSPHWDCVKNALAKKIFPPPPSDGFWSSGTIG